MLSSSCSSARIAAILCLLKSYSPAEPLWISNVSDAYALQSGGCLSVHIVFRSLIVKLASTTETRCRYNKHTQFMQSSFLAISHSATFVSFFICLFCWLITEKVIKMFRQFFLFSSLACASVYQWLLPFITKQPHQYIDGIFNSSLAQRVNISIIQRFYHHISMILPFHHWLQEPQHFSNNSSVLSPKILSPQNWNSKVAKETSWSSPHHDNHDF